MSNVSEDRELFTAANSNLREARARIAEKHYESIVNPEALTNKEVNELIRFICWKMCLQGFIATPKTWRKDLPGSREAHHSLGSNLHRVWRRKQKASHYDTMWWTFCREVSWIPRSGTISRKD